MNNLNKAYEENGRAFLRMADAVRKLGYALKLASECRKYTYKHPLRSKDIVRILKQRK